jgi:hypothetical protein
LKDVRGLDAFGDEVSLADISATPARSTKEAPTIGIGFAMRVLLVITEASKVEPVETDTGTERTS